MQILLAQTSISIAKQTAKRAVEGVPAIALHAKFQMAANGLIKPSRVIQPVRRRLTKQQTHLVEVTQALPVVVMWFAASTDPTGYRLGIDGGKLMKKRTAWILVAVCAIISIGWWGSGQLKIDSCLDSGGRWNYETTTCEK